MKPVFADFNAMTESGHLRLNCRGSQEDLRAAGLRSGEWTWLSDGEVLVGGKLGEDPRYGVVGIPAWQTLVHLDDDEEAEDVRLIAEEFRSVIDRPPERSAEWGAKVLRLVTLVEMKAPAEFRAMSPPGWFAGKRAVALAMMGQTGLALAEAEESLREDPESPQIQPLYLELLRVTDLPEAIREAEARASQERAGATVLAACIDILATDADDRPDAEMDAIMDRLRDWLERFEDAPGRDAVPASTLARVYFEVGQLALRQGDRERARNFLQLAALANPKDSAIVQAAGLVTFDQAAKQLVQAIHARLSAA